MFPVRSVLEGIERPDAEGGKALVARKPDFQSLLRELGLAKLPEPHDVSDALAVALCHYYATSSALPGGSKSVTFTGVNRKKLFGDKDETP